MTPADWYIIWGGIALIYLGIGVVVAKVMAEDEPKGKMSPVDRNLLIIGWLPLLLAIVFLA